MLWHRLTDQEWASIADLFPPPAAHRPPAAGPPADRRRRPLDPPDRSTMARPAGGVRALGHRLGPLRQVERRRDAGHDPLLPAVGRGGGDGGLRCVDGTVVRAARCAAGGGRKKTRTSPWTTRLGRSRRGYSTNVHIHPGGRDRRWPLPHGEPENEDAHEKCDDRHRHLPDDEVATQGGGLAGPFLAALVPGGDGDQPAGSERAAGGRAVSGGPFRLPDHPDL